ncbi:MAG TPA: DUF4352 domain-containing protein [Pseudogracilibacillus sp.]|nr:DUF4352 domain-containing protein [Pseudogracilibacillus sp.]
MAKKIKGEDGKMYKESKPFYKKIWFWVVVVLLVFFVIGAFGGDDEDTAEKVESDEKTEQSSKKEKDPLDKTFKVGDTVSYKGIELKVNSVDYQDATQDDIEMHNIDDGNQFVIVNLTINNNSDEKLYYNTYDFRLNADGNAKDMDLYLDNINNTIEDGNLDKEASLTGNLIGQGSPDAKLKLQYETDFWNDETVDINLN